MVLNITIVIEKIIQGDIYQTKNNMTVYDFSTFIPNFFVRVGISFIMKKIRNIRCTCAGSTMRKKHSRVKNLDSSPSLSFRANRYTGKLNCKAQRKYSQVDSLKGRWQQWADQHIQSQKLNPFSEEFDYQLAMSTRLRKGDEGYGRPKEGTKTAERAKRAEEHIYREIMDMCFIIRTMARHRCDGKIQVTFGDLFDRYVRISDKVVGILMRARKHGLVDFEGEMLWQGQDDHVLITLLE